MVFQHLQVSADSFPETWSPSTVLVRVSDTHSPAQTGGAGPSLPVFLLQTRLTALADQQRPPAKPRPGEVDRGRRFSLHRRHAPASCTFLPGAEATGGDISAIVPGSSLTRWPRRTHPRTRLCPDVVTRSAAGTGRLRECRCLSVLAEEGRPKTLARPAGGLDADTQTCPWRNFATSPAPEVLLTLSAPLSIVGSSPPGEEAAAPARKEPYS